MCKASLHSVNAQLYRSTFARGEDVLTCIIQCILKQSRSFDIKYVFLGRSEFMKDYGSFTDQQLVTLLKDRDDSAFTEIYERYWSVLYIHARRLLQDEDLAQDAIHDVFATLWKKAADIELTTSLNAYLYRTVKNAILNDIRHERVAANYLADLKRFYQEGVTSTDELVHLKELQALIEQEIQNLPDEMRKVFEMSRKRHLSNAEIARELNKSELTVKNQIKRAKDILRDRLDLPSLLILLLLKP